MCTRKLVPIRKAGSFGGRPAGRKCKIWKHKYTLPQNLSINFQKKFRRVGVRPANRNGVKKAS